jgi:hypothetical protein
MFREAGTMKARRIRTCVRLVGPDEQSSDQEEGLLLAASAYSDHGT